jgi:FkbM family methyltransferase
VRDPYHVRATDRVIVDAGANIGCFSIYAASKAPRARIYALEPSRSNYAKLVKNVRMNRLETRICIEPFGVAGQTGVLELNTEQASPYHSAFLPGGRNSERIEVRSLADALAALLDVQDEVDLLKMDCEGGEMDCLLNADSSSLRRIGRIAIEYHEWAGFDFAEMRLKLDGAGFRLADRHHQPLHPTGTAVFVRD